MIFKVDASWVRSKLPQRKQTDHKARQGHLLILAGHEGFWGSGVLCSLSAYRMGVGYVTWACQKTPPIQNVPEVLTKKITDLDLFKNKTAVAIGPGLGVNKATRDLILKLKSQNQPVVVDADAFTVCVQENLFPLPHNWVVTPHSGELARLFGIQGKDVDQDRDFFAQKAFEKLQCAVLLKGFRSLLIYKEKFFLIFSGNSSLAKAGTGDVLTGFIGALMARGLSSFEAAAVGAFIHGHIADEWVESGRDKDTLIAQDLKDRLPFILQKIRNQPKDDPKR